MRWIVVAVVAGGWVYAGFTNLPRVPQPYAATAGLAIAATCAVCWWAGRRSGRGSAFAAAYAAAEARAAAAARAESSAVATNAVFVQVGDGGRHRAAAGLDGLDTAPWIAGPRPLLEQDTAQMLAEDVLEQRTGEVETG